MMMMMMMMMMQSMYSHVAPRRRILSLAHPVQNIISSALVEVTRRITCRKVKAAKSVIVNIDLFLLESGEKYNALILCIEIEVL
jgi:hypothetical protein